MCRTATFLLLSSLFFTITLSQRIIGGERSIWDLDGYNSYSLSLDQAYLYDRSINAFGRSAFSQAYDTNLRPSTSNWYGSPYYSYNYGQSARASGSFVSETYQYDNLNFTKEFYVSPTLPALRSYFTLTAINEPVQLEIEVYARIPSYYYPYTTLYADYNDNGFIDDNDEWYVTGSAFTNTNVPFVTWSIFGPGATQTPTDSFDGYGYISNTFELELLPGIPQSLLFFAELSLTSDEAVDAASKFDNLSELRKTDLLFGFTDNDFKQIVNWGLQTPRKVTSYTGICDFADEIKDRVSKLRSNERHSFNQPWSC